MEIYYAEPKTIRFDINKLLIARKAINEPIKSSLEALCWPKNNKLDKILIGLRIRTHITELGTNEEIIGYVYEYLAGVIPKDIQNDKIDLKRFVANALLNYQANFQNNAPIELQNFQLLQKVNETDLIEKLSDLIKKVGGY